MSSCRRPRGLNINPSLRVNWGAPLHWILVGNSAAGAGVAAAKGAGAGAGTGAGTGAVSTLLSRASMLSNALRSRAISARNCATSSCSAKAGDGAMAQDATSKEDRMRLFKVVGLQQSGGVCASMTVLLLIYDNEVTW